MTVRVRCSFEIEVEVPNEWADGHVFFAIEDNSCPATHHVGAALKRHMEEHAESSTCWACALQAKNEIVAIDGKPVRNGRAA